MKLYHCVSVLLILIVFVPLSTNAGLVWGPSARTFFEEHRDRNLDMFTDFEGTPTGIYNLLPVGIPSDTAKFARLLFELDTTEIRYPLPVRPAPAGTKVAVLPYDFVSTPPNHRLMGVQATDRPDGQSKYQIKFIKCLDRVGLKRMWNTYSTTRFYQQDRLLAEHRNTTNTEFVGYVMEPNTTDECVTRVEFDGHPQQSDDEHNKLYMVGEVDDLFYSVPAVLVGVLTNSGSNSVVSAGDKVIINIAWKNYGSYSVDGLKLTVEYYDHEKKKTVWWTKAYGLDARGRGFHNFEIKTTKDTKVGYYKVKVSIRSSSEVLVDETINWYFVKTKSKVSPSINLLFLRDK